MELNDMLIRIICELEKLATIMKVVQLYITLLLQHLKSMLTAEFPAIKTLLNHNVTIMTVKLILISFMVEEKIMMELLIALNLMLDVNYIFIFSPNCFYKFRYRI